MDLKEYSDITRMNGVKKTTVKPIRLTPFSRRELEIIKREKGFKSYGEIVDYLIISNKKNKKKRKIKQRIIREIEF